MSIIDADELDFLIAERNRAIAAKDNAYRERDLCVALIAKLADSIRAGSAWLGQHDPADAAWDPDWRNIVFVELPTGQLSWHIHDSELPLFEFLKGRRGLSWDGHTTEEKYERVKAALRLRSVEFTP